MAKLTIAQTNRQAARQLERLEEEKRKQEALIRKKDIQNRKELFGENYKEVERATIEKTIADEIGSSDTPKIYDFIDVYDYFDPVIMFKSKEGKALNVDLKKFQKSQQELEQELIEVDALLEKINSGDKSINQEEVKENTKEENKLQDDGVNELDSVDAASEDEVEEHEKEQKEAIEHFELEESIPKQSLIALAKGRLNKIASIYFNRFVPKYNKWICDCCGVPKNESDYYVVYDITCNSKIDKSGARRMHICKDCANKLFAYYYAVDSGKNADIAMQYTCSALNLYWDVDAFQIVRKQFDESGRKGTLLGAYIKYINSNAPGMTFMDSPFLQDGYQPVSYTNTVDETPYDWSAQEAKNRKDIIHLLGYDPFSYEKNDEDRKILYADLINIIDEDIQQDYVKLQSAVTIVKSFTKVRKLDEKLNQMEIDDAPLNDQKAVADLKVKELKAISDFSRDSGFSERFKTRQSQGETSFTGIIKKMNEKKYEDELINKYDIATSSTIQAAADASFKAIFNQLNLSEAEAYKLAADQLTELRKVKKENEKLQEDLRLAKYEVAELKLKEKAREKGVDVDGS